MNDNDLMIVFIPPEILFIHKLYLDISRMYLVVAIIWTLRIYELATHMLLVNQRPFRCCIQRILAFVCLNLAEIHIINGILTMYEFYARLFAIS